MSAACIACPAAGKAVTGASIANTTAIAYTAAIPDSAVSTPAIVSTATPISAATPVAVIPRAGADKDATHEPARSIVAIRRASVGIIGIIAP
jgi:hypothetical protein